MKIKKGFYILIAILSIAAGLYPLVFLLMDMQFELIASKNNEILSDVYWNIGFYSHIIFGGIALSIGWIQFIKKLRSRNIQLHRIIGRIYIISVLLSALGGIYIGFFSKGLITSTGFTSLGFIWLYATLKAYIFVKEKNTTEYENMMIYSYAACFAAVTLRLWLPLFVLIFKDFDIAYKLVAWLCWIPNLIVAYYIIRNRSIDF